MENPLNTNLAHVRAGGFASTQWSVVLMAGGARNAPEVQEALAQLCAAYWYPIYVFIRRQQHSANDAEELTQEFFARFLEKDLLGSVDKSRGRFRTFLLACCRHFLANQRQMEKAQKRGGGRLAISLDLAGAAERYRTEPAETPEKLFERRWALTILDQVMAKLQHEYETAGKRALFDHLKSVLLGGTGYSYSRIGVAVGMKEEAVRKAAQRLRERYRSALRECIAETVNEPEEVDEEIRDLFAALA